MKSKVKIITYHAWIEPLNTFSTLYSYLVSPRYIWLYVFKSGGGERRKGLQRTHTTSIWSKQTVRCTDRAAVESVLCGSQGSNDMSPWLEREEYHKRHGAWSSGRMGTLKSWIHKITEGAPSLFRLYVGIMGGDLCFVLGCIFVKLSGFVGPVRGRTEHHRPLRDSD